MAKLTQQQLNQLRQLARTLSPESFEHRSSGSPDRFVAYCAHHPEGITHPIKGAFSKSDLDAKIAEYCAQWNAGETRLEAIAALEAAEAKAKKAAEPKSYDLSALPSDLQGSISNFRSKDYLFLQGVIAKYEAYLQDNFAATVARNGNLQITGSSKIKKCLKALSNADVIAAIDNAWAVEQVAMAERAKVAKAESDRKKAEAAQLKAERKAKRDADHFADAIAAIKALGFEPIGELVTFNLIGYKQDWQTLHGHINVNNKTAQDFWICRAEKPWKDDDNEYYQSDWKTPVVGVYYRGPATIAKEKEAEAKQIVTEICDLAKAQGTQPERSGYPGEKVYTNGVRESIYYDEASAEIWWIWYNGNDGDDWRDNNVKGVARGWMLPATPELIDKIDKLKLCAN